MSDGSVLLRSKRVSAHLKKLAKEVNATMIHLSLRPNALYGASADVRTSPLGATEPVSAAGTGAFVTGTSSLSTAAFGTAIDGAICVRVG
jgi:hypothetical protein